MKIQTEQHPYNTFECRATWTAVDDDTYDGPECPVGWGSTEIEAINDLVEQTIGELEDKVEDLRFENRCIRAENQALLSRCLQNTPETCVDDPRQRVFPWQVMSGPSSESPEPPRADNEEDREESRCQGRVADEPPEWDSGYDDKRYDDAEWS